MAEDTKNRYVEAVGRRKTSSARARLTEASKASFLINDKAIEDYFKTEEIRKIAT